MPKKGVKVGGLIVVLSVFRMSMALVALMMLIGVIAPCIAVDNSADNAP